MSVGFGLNLSIAWYLGVEVGDLKALNVVRDPFDLDLDPDHDVYQIALIDRFVVCQTFHVSQEFSIVETLEDSEYFSSMS